MTPGFRQKTNWRLPMKPFSLLKIPVLLVGFGALLFFSPTCKAKSEVNPAHFDGTAPWEIAARKSVTSTENSEYHLFHPWEICAWGKNASRRHASQQPNSERNCNSIGRQRHGRQDVF